jgi:hypothetical protein
MDGKQMNKDQVRSTEEAFSTERALDLALDALDNLLYWDNGKSDYDQAREAITAIKQARSAPVQSAERGEPVGTAGQLFSNTALERLDLRPSTNIYITPFAPIVPDVLTTAEGEHPEYVQGWNDCRQLMLQTRNNRHD